LLTADVAEFYRSVYTHAIPWALHTKQVAKENRRDATLAGNQIDIAVRRCQRDETMGIPVGPDTSFVIGEFLLATIDSRLANAVSPIAGSRHYDDYELVFEERRDAERALAVVQDTMAEYNLLLNPTKTFVSQLPRPIHTPWSGPLSQADVSSGQGLPLRITRFFDVVAGIQAAHPDANALSYAIARFDDDDLVGEYSQDEWNLIQSALCHFVTNDPSAIVQFIKLFASVEIGDSGLEVNRKDLEYTLNRIVAVSAPLGHGSDTSWALWGLIAFGLRLNNQSAKAISQMRDSIVALLALDARARSLVDGDLDTELWSRLVSREQLHGEHWLLAYEAPVHGWLGTTEHISSDRCYSLLLENEINFYTKFRRLSRRVVKGLHLWSTDYGDADSSSESDSLDADPADTEEF
jgi:hypothetical protein